MNSSNCYWGELMKHILLIFFTILILATGCVNEEPFESTNDPELIQAKKELNVYINKHATEIVSPISREGWVIIEGRKNAIFSYMHKYKIALSKKKQLNSKEKRNLYILFELDNGMFEPNDRPADIYKKIQRGFEIRDGIDKYIMTLIKKTELSFEEMQFYYIISKLRDTRKQSE